MSAKLLKDRRKYPRIPSSDVVSFSEVERTHKLGVAKDFSPGGIRFFAMGCEIELGKVLEVHFYVGPSFISAVGRVVHATEVDGLTTDIGLEFVELEPVAAAVIREFYKRELQGSVSDSWEDCT
jgi:hypothetical protein